MTGGGNAGREAQQAREDELARQARIAQGTRDVRTGFDQQYNGQYYKDLTKSVSDYYTKQLDTQYGQSLKQLNSALLGRGLSDSSIGAGERGKAQVQYNTQAGDIAQKALGVSAQRRQDVIGSENSIINQLNYSGDAGIAAAQAAQQQAAFSQAPSVPLLGSVFQDFTAGLSTQADQENQGTNRYNIFNRFLPQRQTSYSRNIGG